MGYCQELVDSATWIGGVTMNFNELSRISIEASDLSNDLREKYLAVLALEVQIRIAAILDDVDKPDDGFLRPIKGNISEQLAESKPIDPMVGRKVGQYTLIERIGSGGMGTVYRAHRDGDFKQVVAVKLISGNWQSNKEIVRRFENERQIQAALKHPAVAHLLDGGTVDGTPYFVMEYVVGKPITQYSQDAKLGITARLVLFQKVCAAVEYCHQSGVIHRDLKPSNILVMEDGNPKIVDFGIAKVINEGISFQKPVAPTATANRFVSIDYASPEQVNGEFVRTTGDVYSLGVVLYELLTGFLPLNVSGKPSGNPQSSDLLADAFVNLASSRPAWIEAISEKRELWSFETRSSTSPVKTTSQRPMVRE